MAGHVVQGRAQAAGDEHEARLARSEAHRFRDVRLVVADHEDPPHAPAVERHPTREERTVEVGVRADEELVPHRHDSHLLGAFEAHVPDGTESSSPSEGPASPRQTRRADQ